MTSWEKELQRILDKPKETNKSKELKSALKRLYYSNNKTQCPSLRRVINGEEIKQRSAIDN